MSDMTASPSPHRAIEAQAWTPEPWRMRGRPTDGRLIAVGPDNLSLADHCERTPETVTANQERAVACVNALAGIADPAAFVAAALAAGVKP